jgi:hypothetical protein
MFNLLNANVKGCFGMSEKELDNSDSQADVFAAVATIAIVVGTAVYWLSGMPV